MDSRLFRFFILLAAVAIIPLAACKKPPESRLLVYIMAGQSNMAGRGAISPEDTFSDPRIFTIDAAKQMVLAREPLHFYHPGFEGLDCGMSFAKTLLEKAPEGTRICLVPAAMSSTSVQEWLGDSLRGQYLFTNAVTRAQIAVDQGGTLAGVLWHQGEANAESSLRARDYDKALDSLVLAFRTKLNAPRMPFFAGTLAAFCARPFKDDINRDIAKLAQQTPNFILVPAYDLSGRSDSVHFDAPAQRELGKRFAQAAAAFL